MTPEHQKSTLRPAPGSILAVARDLDHQTSRVNALVRWCETLEKQLAVTVRFAELATTKIAQRDQIIAELSAGVVRRDGYRGRR